MVFTCNSVYTFHGNTLCDDVHLTGKSYELRRKIALQIFGYEYLVNILSGLNGLHYGTNTVDIIAFLHI